MNPETAATVVKSLQGGTQVRLAYCENCQMLVVALDRFQERCGKCHSPFKPTAPSLFVQRSTMSGPTQLDDGGMGS